MSVIDIDDLWADLLEVPHHGRPVYRAVPVLSGRDNPLARRLDVVCIHRSALKDVLCEALPRARAVERPQEHPAVTASDQGDVAPDPAVVIQGKLEPGSERARDAAQVPLPCCQQTFRNYNKNM